ncbi:malonyl-ACP O-methyltransferase BioC [Thalassobius sp. I31.1]|uniref:malonyl-ACP O-methyltransferase BioC n=1 Tax=Thalassobius sp. I31.1 TaxID=2109912 RepID=UPI00130026A8|nr:malonyl-ACP O-methyltransferase BioC [Thalassobius sp. I31.1]
MTIPLHASRVEQSFRRGFASYDSHASCQKEIASKLAALFVQNSGVIAVENLLEIGCGTGFLTRTFAQSLSADHRVLNDLVPESREYLDRLPDLGRWDFLPGSVEATPLPGQFDLITSASALQWVNDTPALLQRLCDHLNPGGWLAISSFGSDHFRELRAFHDQPCDMAYFNPGEWQAMLPEGMKACHIAQDHHTDWFERPLDLLKHLRKTGVNGNARQQWSRRDLMRFSQDYKRQYGAENGDVPLTWVPVYVIAQKA